MWCQAVFLLCRKISGDIGIFWQNATPVIFLENHMQQDRMVKQFIARHAKAPPANRRLPQVQAFVPALVDRSGAIRADAAELAANPRARSAVLRVAEKLDGQGRLAA